MWLSVNAQIWINFSSLGMIRFENIQARDHPKSLNELIERSTPQFHIHPLSSTHRFHTKATPFQRPKSLSSTPKTPQFNTETPRFHTENPSVPNQKTPQFHTKNLSVQHNWGGTEGFLVWNWGGGTEGFSVWNWEVLGAEKKWPFCVEMMTHCVELRGRGMWNWGGPDWKDIQPQISLHVCNIFSLLRNFLYFLRKFCFTKEFFGLLFYIELAEKIMLLIFIIITKAMKVHFTLNGRLSLQ